MNNNDHNKSINPDDLPEEVFKRREVFQHPQPAGTGKALNNDDRKNDTASEKGKTAEKTSAKEGLNEANSDGDAGAFEGFEDHGDA